MEYEIDFRTKNLDTNKIFDREDAEYLDKDDNILSDEDIYTWNNTGKFTNSFIKELEHKIGLIVKDSFTSDFRLSAVGDAGIVSYKSSGKEYDGCYGHSSDKEVACLADFNVLDKAGAEIGTFCLNITHRDVSEDLDQEGFSCVDIQLKSSCFSDDAEIAFAKAVLSFKNAINTEMGLEYIPTELEWEKSKKPEKVTILINSGKFEFCPDPSIHYFNDEKPKEKNFGFLIDVGHSGKIYSVFVQENDNTSVRVLLGGKHDGFLEISTVASHGFTNDFKKKTREGSSHCFLEGYTTCCSSNSFYAHGDVRKALELNDIVNMIQEHSFLGSIMVEPLIKPKENLEVKLDMPVELDMSEIDKKFKNRENGKGIGK